MAITDKLKEIADAIREKTDTTDLMRLDQMDDLIEQISSKELPDYEGLYSVQPGFDPIILETDEKSLRENVTIKPISVIEVENQSNGNTLII